MPSKKYDIDIHDKLLDPYFIKIDEDNYTVFRKDVNEWGKERHMLIGYFSCLSKAMDKIIKLIIVGKNAGTTFNLEEYKFAISKMEEYVKLIIKELDIDGETYSKLTGN